MNKQQYEADKAILSSAPDDNWTHVSDNIVYYWNKPDGLPHAWWLRGEDWIDSPVHHFLRERSDIEYLCAQYERIAKLKAEIEQLKRDKEVLTQTHNKLFDAYQRLEGNIAKRDLVRQAMGIEDAVEYVGGSEGDYLDFAKQLRKQAEEL